MFPIDWLSLCGAGRDPRHESRATPCTAPTEGMIYAQDVEREI